MAYNVLQPPEGGDIGAIQCQSSTKVELTTSPPLEDKHCCRQAFSVTNYSPNLSAISATKGLTFPIKSVIAVLSISTSVPSLVLPFL